MKTLLNVKFVLVIAFFVFAQTNYAQWSTNGTSIVYTTDNVGIGTSTPSYKLDLSGYLRVNSTSYPGRDYRILCTNRQDIYANNDLVTHVNGNKEFRIGVTGTDKFFCITDGSGTKRFWVYENGNVGIGCSNPQVKLAVNGTIKATELQITTTPCSDFVFEKGYNLMDLNTLEKFVTNNKHLPDVPSAKEFEENGYSVGEMDDILLRKIEELTLYIIDQQKEFIKQQKEIEELKSKLR
jgi:hypothetical protein